MPHLSANTQIPANNLLPYIYGHTCATSFLHTPVYVTFLTIVLLVRYTAMHRDRVAVLQIETYYKALSGSAGQGSPFSPLGRFDDCGFKTARL